MRINTRPNFWVAAAIMAAVLLAVTAGVSAAGLAREARTPSDVPHIETSLPLTSQVASSSVLTETAESFMPTFTPTPRAESPDDADHLTAVPPAGDSAVPRHPTAAPESPEADSESDDDDDREVVVPDVREDEDDEDHED